MQRVAIIGSGGAGKSTLARRLGQVTGLPVTHLDALSWLPGWKERDKDEFDQRVLAITTQDRWIIDGNYSRTIEHRLRAADTIIWLDFPRHVCLWRVVKRWHTHRGRQRPDMGEGCPEKIDLEFILWVWNYPTRSRERTIERLRVHATGKTVHQFTRSSHVESWLTQLQPA